jgi:phosphoglycerate dehydrogenase-like enzyme
VRIVGLRQRASPAPAVPGVEIELMGTLAEVLAGADHVVIAAPLTPQTHHLLDAGAFRSVKPGVHVVNIARGGLIDQDALLAALDDGTVSRASLDVTTPEPLPADHPLAVHPRAFITPHVSWSGSAPGREIDLFLANWHRWLAGEALEAEVDVAAGY